MAKFIMLIGLPGSGKSYIAEKTKEKMKNVLVVSSDEIRKELFGDENDQQNPEMVFETMRERTFNALKDGIDVIYDATNIRRKYRRALLRSLPNCEKIAYVVWSRYDLCVKRDAERSRTVGEPVIKKMLLGFQPPFYDEGWDKIEVDHNGKLYTQSDYEDWMNCDHDNPHHNNTVGVHTQQVCDEAFKLSYDALNDEKYSTALTNMIVLFAAAMHDTGKKFTKTFTNFKGETTEIAHYYDHHNVSSYYTLGFEKLMTMSIEERLLISWLVNVHMEPFFGSKYYKNLKPDLKSLVDALHSCDVKGA